MAISYLVPLVLAIPHEADWYPEEEVEHGHGLLHGFPFDHILGLTRFKHLLCVPKDDVFLAEASLLFVHLNVSLTLHGLELLKRRLLPRLLLDLLLHGLLRLLGRLELLSRHLTQRSLRHGLVMLSVW